MILFFYNFYFHTFIDFVYFFFFSNLFQPSVGECFWRFDFQPSVVFHIFTRRAVFLQILLQQLFFQEIVILKVMFIQ